MYTNRQNDKLPLGRLTVLGFQHVLAMYVGAVLVPLVLGAAIGLSQENLAYLVSADLFTCGIATFIQSFGLGKGIGIRLPVIMGCSSVAIIPMIAIGQIYGITAIYGSILVSGILIILLAPWMRALLRFFPPLVVGSVITILGLSLVIIAWKSVFATKVPGEAAHMLNILLAFFVIVLIVVINKYCRGFIRMIAVLLSLIIGTVVAYFLGKVNFAIVGQAHWFNVVTPFYFGLPSFKIGAIISICLVTLVNIIDSVGVFLTVGNMCDTKIDKDRFVAGFRAEGIAQVLGGIFNSFPYITYSQNIGLLELTKVKSRYVTIASGIILVILGLIPKLSALITTIPKAVLGGAMIVLFGMVVATGIRILAQVDCKKFNNFLVIAITIGVGLGMTAVSGLFAHTHLWIRIIFSNGIIISCFTAVIANLVLNGVKDR